MALLEQLTRCLIIRAIPTTVINEPLWCKNLSKQPFEHQQKADTQNFIDVPDPTV